MLRRDIHIHEIVLYEREHFGLVERGLLYTANAIAESALGLNGRLVVESCRGKRLSGNSMLCASYRFFSPIGESWFAAPEHPATEFSLAAYCL